jgi:AbiJ N-terminal domain 4
MEKSFSQRMGLKPGTIIQIDSMTDELRKALWNDFYGEFGGKKNWGVVRSLIYSLWCNFFHKLLDEAHKYDALWETIKTFYFSLEWQEVYDFIEFVANEYEGGSYLDELIKSYNITLKKYLSAYRFIGKNLVKITSEQEIAEIEEALAVSKQFTPHLDQALTLLADRNVPDYRNSIKESISAVEAMCQLIVDDENVSLGKALTRLESKIGSFHKSFRNALNHLYGWTSDAQGIRHALLGESDLDIEDARFMLIVCSAFINYLAAKVDKAGIELTLSKEGAE